MKFVEQVDRDISNKVWLDLSGHLDVTMQIHEFLKSGLHVFNVFSQFYSPGGGTNRGGGLCYSVLKHRCDAFYRDVCLLQRAAR